VWRTSGDEIQSTKKTGERKKRRDKKTVSIYEKETGGKVYSENKNLVNSVGAGKPEESLLF